MKVQPSPYICKLRCTPRAIRGFFLVFPLFVLLGYGPMLFRHLLERSTPSAPPCDTRGFEPLLSHDPYAPPSTSNATPTRKKGNINTATARDLTEVTYVGKVLSERIVSYREQLGGYYRLSQLQEVKGLSHRAIRNIKKKYAVVREACCQKMSINRMSQESLSAHPYFSFDNAGYVMTHLRTHGRLTGEKDLLRALRGDKNLVLRVRAYIAYD